MNLHNNTVIETNATVWSTLKTHHDNDLVVFLTYTDEYRSDTCYALEGAHHPLICIRLTGDGDFEYMTSKYYLVVAKNESND